LPRNRGTPYDPLVPSLLATAMLLVLGPAPESGFRVAVLPLVTDASVDEGIAVSVQEQLDQGLRRGGLDLVGADELATAGPARCHEAACIRKISATTGARFVIRPHLVQADRVFTVELELLDGETGKAVAHSRDQCDICGRQEVAAVVSDQASMLADKIDALARPTTRLRIDSTPAGATVWIDQERVGQTPLSREVLPGEHVVRLERGGFASEQRRLDVTSGLEHRVDLALLALPADAKPARPGRKLVPAGAAILAAGTLATIGGVVLLALDDRQYRRRCDGNDIDVNGTCRYSYDTTTAGAVLTAVGLGSVAAGIALVTVGKRRHHEMQAAFGPRGVTLRGRF
jgi:PEGA domain